MFAEGSDRVVEEHRTERAGGALGRFWPRARSKLYEEPKKLVAHGLARSATESVGKRPRTTYSITAKGKRAMAAWVPAPGGGPQVEFESLIKVFFAEHGSKADLVATLHRSRDWAREQATESQLSRTPTSTGPARSRSACPGCSSPVSSCRTSSGWWTSGPSGPSVWSRSGPTT